MLLFTKCKRNFVSFITNLDNWNRFLSLDDFTINVFRSFNYWLIRSTICGTLLRSVLSVRLAYVHTNTLIKTYKLCKVMCSQNDGLIFKSLGWRIVLVKNVTVRMVTRKMCVWHAAIRTQFSRLWLESLTRLVVTKSDVKLKLDFKFDRSVGYDDGCYCVSVGAAENYHTTSS